MDHLGMSDRTDEDPSDISHLASEINAWTERLEGTLMINDEIKLQHIVSFDGRPLNAKANEFEQTAHNIRLAYIKKFLNKEATSIPVDFFAGR